MSTNSEPIKIFIDYADVDRSIMKKLLIHLKPLENENQILTWSYEMIKPGKPRKDEINKNLNEADIILALLSPDFLALKRVNRHKNNKAIIIPIILRYCSWNESSFAKFQVLPDGGKPIESWSLIDEPLSKIASSIRNQVRTIKTLHIDEEIWDSTGITETEKRKLYDLLITNAAKYFKDTKWHEAIEIYQQSLVIHQSSYKPTKKELQKLIKKCNIEMAYEESIRLSEENFEQKEYSQALFFANRALEYKPKNTRALLILKEIKSDKKLFKQKIRYVGLGAFLMITILILCYILTNERQKASNSKGMVLVEGGTFLMGCSSDCASYEQPIHKVSLSSFYIDESEVTNNEFCKFLNSKFSTNEWLETRSYRSMIDFKNNSHYPQKGFEDFPVVEVSWDDANNFAQWKGKRLPTEAEWEFAAIGGNKSKNYLYSGSNNLDSVAFYKDNCKDISPVKKKKPNELGLYDMSGNVWEWCSDWYGKKYYASSDSNNPKGPRRGISKVIRGGAWDHLSRNCRNRTRYSFKKNNRSYNGGFRCVKDVN